MTKPLTDKGLFSLKRQYKRARIAYYNEAPIMSDEAFDKIEDAIRKVEPDWSELHKTGVKVANKKTERALFHFMPSLNKKYPEQLPSFYKSKTVAATLQWIIMDKLDGTALQVRYFQHVPTHLITRGDGTNGGDVSFLLPALIAAKRIPKRISAVGEVVLRLEGIMHKDVFDKRWSRDAVGSRGFDNIRNGVNGIFNNSKPHAALADIDLVVLGVYGVQVAPGLKVAAQWGFTVVKHCVLDHALNADEMTKLLAKRRKESVYEMDGLVGASANFMYDYKNADKPKGIIAFKVNDLSGAFDVKVLEIIWQKTRLRRWMPKIRIEPIKIDGVMVTHATLHNAAWMTERGIGVGAILKVLRAGGVIPKVVGVVRKALFVATPPGQYELKGRHFVMTEHDVVSAVRGIHHFMVTMGVKLLAQKTIAKLYAATKNNKNMGGFNSIEAYLWRVDEARDDYDNAHQALVDCGLGKVQAKKILDELCRVFHKKVPLVKLMDASGCFEGTIGERKLLQLEEQGIRLKDMLNWKSREWFVDALSELHGFKGKSIDAVYTGVQRFKPWLRAVLPYISVNPNRTVTTQNAEITRGPLSSVNVAFTGYRSKEQEALVQRLGGTVGSFSAKTNVLLYDPNGKTSTKVDKAGERAMIWAAFIRKYKISQLTGYEAEA